MARFGETLWRDKRNPRQPEQLGFDLDAREPRVVRIIPGGGRALDTYATCPTHGFVSAGTRLGLCSICEAAEADAPVTYGPDLPCEMSCGATVRCAWQGQRFLGVYDFGTDKQHVCC